MKAVLTSALLVFAGLAHGGQPAPVEARFVSVYALLGDPDRFDGKVVRVIGVASFDSGFEGEWRLYPTADDHEHRTGSGIWIGSLAPTLEAHKKDFDSLTGKYVIVEGLFKFFPAHEPPAGASCVGCNDAYTLQEVSHAEEWEF
jgi:hypothetical protein